MVRGRRSALAVTWAVIIGSLALAVIPATAVDDSVIEQRVAAAALLRDPQVAHFFSQLDLGIPTRADATFAAPTAPGCEQFATAVNSADAQALVTGARWTSGNDELLQSAWTFSTTKDAQRFRRDIAAADLVACSKATAPADRNLELREFESGEGLLWGDAMFLATQGQLDGGANSAVPKTDFTTFWIIGDEVVSRLALRSGSADIVGDDLQIDDVTVLDAYQYLLDTMNAELVAARSPYLGLVPPRSPDPWAVGSSCDVRVTGQVFETLLTLRPNGELRAGLADEWEISDDGLSYTVTLRDDLEWSDGTPITAADATYAFDQTRANPALRGAIGPVTSVRAVDNLTFEVTLSDAVAASSLWSLTGAAGAIAKPDTPSPLSANMTWLWYSPDIASAATASGFADGERVDALNFVNVPTGGGLAALTAGTADIVVIGPEEIGDARRAGFRVSTTQTGSGANLYFNYGAHPIFGDPRVRQAMAYAIDRDELVDDVLGGRGVVSDAPIGPGWGYRGIFKWAYNPESARRLLEKAGYPLTNPIDVVVFDGTAGPSTDKIVAGLRSDLSELGVPFSVRSGTGAEVARAISDRSAEIVVISSLQQPFPVDTIGQAVLPGFGLAQSTGAAAEFAGSELDSMLDSARLGVTAQERAELYRQMEDILLEETPFVFLYSSAYAIAWDPKEVTGTPKPGIGPCDPWNLEGVSMR